MTWARIDDGFFRHPKARAAGKDGRALFLAGLCWCAAHLTDGDIRQHELGLVAAEAEVNGKRCAQRLVDVGLWEPVEGGWRVHDFDHFNRPAAQVKAEREAVSRKRAEAGRRGARARWGDGKHDGKAIANEWQDEHQDAWQSDSPVPVPTPDRSTEVVVNAVAPSDDDRLSIEVARARSLRLHGTVRSAKWLNAVAVSLDAQRIHELVAQGHDAKAIDALLDGAQTPVTTGPAPVATREINGVLCRHMAGSGWVPIA